MTNRKEVIEYLNNEIANLTQLRDFLAARESVILPPQPKQFARKRHLSAAAKERMAAAQRARWAKKRPGAKKRSGRTSNSVAPKPVQKRLVSTASRKKMAKAQKARWARAKKDKLAA